MDFNSPIAAPIRAGKAQVGTDASDWLESQAVISGPASVLQTAITAIDGGCITWLAEGRYFNCTLECIVNA